MHHAAGCNGKVITQLARQKHRRNDCHIDLFLSLASPSFTQVAKLERPNMDGINRSVMSAGHNHCCINPYSVYLRTEPPVNNMAVA